MIEPISDLPDVVIGFRFTGGLTHSDYAEQLAPTLRGAAAGGEVRLLLVAAAGADLGSLKSVFDSARSDPDLDLGHRRDWRRVAVVADAGLLIRRSFPVWSRVIPVESRLFALREEPAARTWVVG